MRAGPQPVWWALFGLKGRIRRATYALGIALMVTVWWFCLRQVFAFQEGTDAHETWLLILGFFVLGSAYCQYALSHKRLHDLGYPGWYTFGIIALQFIFPMFGWAPYILLAVLPGEPKENAYGPPPVAPTPS